MVLSLTDREGIDFPCEVAKGGIIGIVDLVGCVEGYDSPWAMEDHYHWVLENPRTPAIRPDAREARHLQRGPSVSTTEP
jgi:hypothetical protein